MSRTALVFPLMFVALATAGAQTRISGAQTRIWSEGFAEVAPDAAADRVADELVAPVLDTVLRIRSEEVLPTLRRSLEHFEATLQAKDRDRLEDFRRRNARFVARAAELEARLVDAAIDSDRYREEMRTLGIGYRRLYDELIDFAAVHEPALTEIADTMRGHITEWDRRVSVIGRAAIAEFHRITGETVNPLLGSHVDLLVYTTNSMHLGALGGIAPTRIDQTMPLTFLLWDGQELVDDPRLDPAWKR